MLSICVRPGMAIALLLVVVTVGDAALLRSTRGRHAAAAPGGNRVFHAHATTTLVVEGQKPPSPAPSQQQKAGCGCPCRQPAPQGACCCSQTQHLAHAPKPHLQFRRRFTRRARRQLRRCLRTRHKYRAFIRRRLRRCRERHHRKGRRRKRCYAQVERDASALKKSRKTYCTKHTERLLVEQAKMRCKDAHRFLKRALMLGRRHRYTAVQLRRLRRRISKR